MPINTKVSEKSRFQELYLLIPKTIPLRTENYTLLDFRTSYQELYPYVPKTIPLRTENYTLTYRKLYPSVKEFRKKVKEFSKILPQT